MEMLKNTKTQPDARTPGCVEFYFKFSGVHHFCHTCLDLEIISIYCSKNDYFGMVRCFRQGGFCIMARQIKKIFAQNISVDILYPDVQKLLNSAENYLFAIIASFFWYVHVFFFLLWQVYRE